MARLQIGPTSLTSRIKLQHFETTKLERQVSYLYLSTFGEESYIFVSLMKSLHSLLTMQDDDISDLTSMVSSRSASLPETKIPTTRLHPSRVHQDGDLNDALEYYTPKTKKISGDGADEEHYTYTPRTKKISGDGADEVGGLNNASDVASFNVLPGAYRVPPSPLTENYHETSSETVSSLYHIPNASLVDHSKHTNHQRTINVSQEPELVFAAPLDTGVLQQQRNTLSPFNGKEALENKERKFKWRDEVGNVKNNHSGVIVINKRVLFLLLMVSCLAVIGLVSGVAYYVVANNRNNDDAASDSTTSRLRPPRNTTTETPDRGTTNTGGGGNGGNKGGSARRLFQGII